RTERMDTLLILRSIGYRGRPLADVPFDERRGVIPNDRGRVVAGAGEPLTGVYVTGWIKRGRTGVIGTNKTCAEETVARVVEDFEARRLPTPGGGRKDLGKLLARRQPERISRRGWDAIDRAERERGSGAGRPRVKMTDTAEMVAVGRRRRGLFGG
ncbi:MAG: ferredoxin, partial [Nocardiaceae bacterium]|nr:ferredoxin [Nocardiaceae bacterium]